MASAETHKQKGISYREGSISYRICILCLWVCKLLEYFPNGVVFCLCDTDTHTHAHLFEHTYPETLIYKIKRRKTESGDPHGYKHIPKLDIHSLHKRGDKKENTFVHSVVYHQVKSHRTGREMTLLDRFLDSQVNILGKIVKY